MSVNGIETRTQATEVRTADGDKFELVGRAVAYGVPTKINGPGGGFIEQVAPGAFAAALKAKADVRCTFNHDANAVLGRTKSGTCVLTDSAAGLNFRCILDKTNSTHRDVYASVKRGDVSECSFAFMLQEDGSGDEWATGKDASGNPIPLRTLKNVRLLDVSAVTYPAYAEGTNVSARTAPAKGQRAAAPATKKLTPPTEELLAKMNGMTVEQFRKRADYDRVMRAASIGRSIVAAQDADLRARAEKLGKEIAADTEQEKRDEALRERMNAAAGKTCR